MLLYFDIVSLGKCHFVTIRTTSGSGATSSRMIFLFFVSRRNMRYTVIESILSVLMYYLDTIV